MRWRPSVMDRHSGSGDFASKRRFVTVVKAGLSIGLFAWLLSRVGLRSLGDTIGRADGRWMAVALSVTLVATAVQTTQWHRLLRALGLQRRWLRCLRLVCVGYAFNTVLPSAVGGDVVRAVSVANSPAEQGKGVASVVLQRLCNFPGMMILMGLGLVLTLNDPLAVRVRPAALVAIVAGSVVVVAAGSPMLGWLASRRFLHGRLRPVVGLFRRLHDVRSQRRTLALATLRGTTYWAVSVVNQWCLMHAVGIEAGLAYAAVVVTTVNIITLLPVSINGYGVREGGFSAFLAVGGLATTTQALSMALLLAGQTLVWGVVGIVCWAAPGVRQREAAAPLRAAAALELEATA